MNFVSARGKNYKKNPIHRLFPTIAAFNFWLKFGINFFCKHLRFAKKEKHGILLLRNDALGDFIISIPLMMQIYNIAKKRGISVTIIVSESMRGFASACPFFDTVISIPGRKNMSSFFKRTGIFCKLTGIQADIVINLTIFSRCAIEDWIVYFITAKHKFTLENLGIFPVFPGIEEFRNRTKFIYSGILKYDPQKTLQENEIALVSVALGEKISVNPGNLDFLKPFPETSFLDTAEYFLVVPGSADPRKCWEPEKFAALIDSIAENHPNLQAVMIGSADDMENSRAVRKYGIHKETILDLCGKTSLMQLIALIDKAKFVITNDTGPLHIAAILHKKTFCIIGLGHWGAYAPNPIYRTVDCIHAECDCIRCSWMCRKDQNPKIYPCIRSIEAKTVWQAVHSYLSPHGKRGSIH